MTKRETFDVAKEFLDKVYDAKNASEEKLVVTIAVADLKLELVLNGMDVDLIDDDEMLVHFNVVNKVESLAREEIEAHYAPSHDSTFVMKTTYDDNGEVTRVECVGWYCGGPNDELTQEYSHGGDDLIAIL